MTSAYAEAVERLGWLVDALEYRLERGEDGVLVNSELVRGACTTRRATADEASAVLHGLVELRALVRGPDGHILDRATLLERTAYREGVRAGLSVRRSDGPLVRLCAALPISISPEVEQSVRRWTEDLRAAVVDLAAHAQRELVLASPFWDATVLEEMLPLLTRRLESGVRVRLLGRFRRGVPTGAAGPLSALGAQKGCELLTWYERSDEDPFGARTFHFKAAVADGGSLAYLGTANFTASGLRSRFELGVLLEGEGARRLAGVVEALLSLALPVALA